MAVESRLPNEPKMLPRRPMAAGTSTSRPGYFSSVPVMAPRKAPATRLVDELSTSATRPCRTPAASGPNRTRRRVAIEYGENIDDQDGNGRRITGHGGPGQAATIGRQWGC